MPKVQLLGFLFVLLMSMQLSSCITHRVPSQKSSHVTHDAPPQTSIIKCDSIRTDNGIKNISGRFVNATFLDQILDSVAGHIPVLWYEMNFISTDSVDVFNGVEEPNRIVYRKNIDHYELDMQDLGDTILFTLKDSLIMLVDSASHSGGFNSIFRRIDSTWSLNRLINERTIAGGYILYRKGKPTQQKVVFMPDGSVNGLNGYGPYYSICYSGACVDAITSSFNTINFCSDTDCFHSNQRKTCAFSIDKRDKMLKIYQVKEPSEDAEEEASVGALLFDLRQ